MGSFDKPRRGGNSGEIPKDLASLELLEQKARLVAQVQEAVYEGRAEATLQLEKPALDTDTKDEFGRALQNLARLKKEGTTPGLKVLERKFTVPTERPGTPGSPAEDSSAHFQLIYNPYAKPSKTFKDKCGVESVAPIAHLRLDFFTEIEGQATEFTSNEYWVGLDDRHFIVTMQSGWMEMQPRDTDETPWQEPSAEHLQSVIQVLQSAGEVLKEEQNNE